VLLDLVAQSLAYAGLSLKNQRIGKFSHGSEIAKKVCIYNVRMEALANTLIYSTLSGLRTREGIVIKGEVVFSIDRATN